VEMIKKEKGKKYVLTDGAGKRLRFVWFSAAFAVS
jgi:hypothetical protein